MKCITWKFLRMGEVSHTYLYTLHIVSRNLGIIRQRTDFTNNFWRKVREAWNKEIDNSKSFKLYKDQIRAKLYLDNIHVDVHFWDPEISDFTNYIAVKCRKYMNRNVYFDIKNGEIIFYI